MKVEVTEAPYGLGPLSTPLRAGTVYKEGCLWLCVSEFQSIQLDTRCTTVCTPSRWPRPEGIFLGVIKPNCQDIKEDKGKTHQTHSFSLYYKQYKRQRQKKTMTISGRKRIDRKRENLLTNLHQSHYTQGNSSTGIFSCQSKFLKRTLTTLTSNRPHRPKSRRLTW